jgi:WD40 repeat protein
VTLAPSRDETPTGGPTYDLFVSYAAADRSWVEGYLFDALDATGVRYVSEAAFELGAPRVVEFERAVRASRRTLLVISPAYLADAYAPFGDLLAQTFGIETGSWPVIPLTLEEAPIPPRLAMLVALDATRPPYWSSAVEKLCAAVNRPVPASRPPPCPYPGMLPFREADAARFFGRDAEVGEMVERLRLHRFLAVIGPSGSGKSSLVLAGLLPALRASGLFGSGDWVPVVFRPGETPVDALRLALGGAADPAEAVEALLRRQPDASRLLLVCDQFEEAFTVGREQAAPFQEQLARLVQSERCWVVVTARADFYADLMAAPLWSEIRAHRVEVTPLDETGLRAAIVQPAEGVGVHVDPALVDRLVTDAAGEPGVLPLVQEALVLSWEGLARRFLPLEAYESIAGDDGPAAARSGLQAAMARRADATLAELTPDRQAIARRIFVRLVQFGEGRADTRRQQRMSDLRSAGDDPAELDATVADLVDHRMLTSTGGEDGADRRIDLAHEALITGWPTLRGWLAERREAEQTRRQLDAKAAEWARLGRGQGGLLDEIELGETERWLESADAAELGVDPALTEVAAASRAELDRSRAARRRRVRTLIGSLAVGLLLVTGLAVWGAISARSARRQEQRAVAAQELADEQRAEAEAQRREADARQAEALNLAITARSRQLAADSLQQMDRNLDRAMLLAVAAYRTEPTLQAKSSLLAAAEFSPRLTGFLDIENGGLPVRAVTFTADGQIAAVDDDGVLRRWDRVSGAPVGTPVDLERDQSYQEVVFSPDGRLLAAEDCVTVDEEQQCEIRIVDVATGASAADSIGTTDVLVNGMAFSPDRRLLALSSVANDAIFLWDVDAGRLFGEPMRTRGWSLAFSPDGRVLASGREPESNATGESSVSLWDVATQRLLAETPVTADGGVSDLDFRPDGAAIAAGHGWGKVAMLNASDLTPIGEPFEAPSGVFDVEYSPDGSVLATASYEDDHVLLWEPEDVVPEELAGHIGEVNRIAFDADGTLVSGGVDGRLILWGTGAHHALRRRGARLHSSSLEAMEFDGETVVSAGGADRAGNAPDSPQIVTWDTAARQPADPPVAAADGGTVLSADGTVAAIGDEVGTIALLDSRTGEPIRPPIMAHADAVSAVALSRDGRTLASASCPEPDPDTFCDLAVWDVESGRRIAGGRADYTIGRLSLSPDGGMLAATPGYEFVYLWDVALNQMHPEPLVTDDRITDLAWSADGGLLAVTSQWGGAHGPGASGEDNNNVRVWEVASRSPVGEPLLGHEAGVTAAAFSPDGTVLASADYTGEIRMWDVDSMSPLGETIETGGASVVALRFGADGTTLASGHGDGRVQLWDTSPESWITRLCATAGRDLTAEEWEEFLGDIEYEPTCPETGN